MQLRTHYAPNYTLDVPLHADMENMNTPDSIAATRDDALADRRVDIGTPSVSRGPQGKCRGRLSGVVLFAGVLGARASIVVCVVCRRSNGRATKKGGP